MPETEESKSGTNENLVRSIIKTSIANTIPAIGVLKMALIPAAEPQASNNVISL